MRTIQIRFRGGPLDGESYRERVPDRWDHLRVEHRRNDRLHVYSGPVPRSGNLSTLDYLGCETESEVSE